MRVATPMLCVTATVLAQYQQPQYGAQVDYQPAYAPAKPAYQKEDPKKHYDQFWDNLELCNAEYDLSSCLLDCDNRVGFFEEQRIAKCTVSFVRGLCGKLAATKSKGCDNGQVKLDADNCPTAAFADAFLVFNKMVADLNTALYLTPSFDSWIFTTIKMAVTTTRNNADCVINSFFNFLNQCATSSYISSNDIQCVEKYLTNETCEFAKEDGDAWNLPLIIERYGLAGTEEVIEKLKHGYGTDRDADIVPALRKVMDSIASQDAHGINFVTTEYNYHSRESSINVCPQLWVPMNELYEASGILGIPIGDVAFHFPQNETLTFENATVAADPITDKTIYDVCEAYFEETKAIIQNGTVPDPGDICVSISDYNLHYIESGLTVPLSFEAINQTIGDDQCYRASWDEAKTCSSHLTEWQMTVSCCKSYGTIQKHNEPKQDHGYSYGYVLAEDEEYQQYQQPQQYDQQQQYQQPQQYDQQYNNQYQQPQQYNNQYQPNYAPYHPSGPAVVKISKKSLVFKEVIVSNTKKGVLTSGEDPVGASGTDRVTAAFDAYNAKLEAKCDSIDFANIPEYGWGYHIHQFCESVSQRAEAIAAHDNTTTLMADGAYDSVEVEYKLYKHPYYLGDSYASKMICKTLDIDLDFEAIVPLVSGKCFPQACILSQLATCMEIPEKKAYGYDYVAQPYYAPAQAQAGYGAPQYGHQQPSAGYHQASSYSSYQTLLASGAGEIQNNYAALSTVGFVAGIAVAAIVQGVWSSLGRRSTINTQHLV